MSLFRSFKQLPMHHATNISLYFSAIPVVFFLVYHLFIAPFLFLRLLVFLFSVAWEKLC